VSESLMSGVATPESYLFEPGRVPLIISIPHMGLAVPEDLHTKMTPVGRELADTDWHLDRLYEFGKEMGASFLMARYSRYVVDLNRPPNDETLYPGQTKTGLFPQFTFRGEPIYTDSTEPSEQEREQRLANYWHPYHDQLTAEIGRLKAEHGQVLVWEAHSIASVLPRLFEGRLADLNVGTNAGSSAAPEVLSAIQGSLTGCRYTYAINGRFKGGYNTRHFGDPAHGVHTVQLEMCQSTYMREEAPFEYRPALADQIKPVVKAMMQAALDAVVTLRR